MTSLCWLVVYFQKLTGEITEPEKFNLDIFTKLVIKNVQLEDGGRYSCGALPGNEKEIANLIVIGK